MRSKQKGYTLVELMIVISVLVSACAAIGVMVVAGHFIAKCW